MKGVENRQAIELHPFAIYSNQILKIVIMKQVFSNKDVANVWAKRQQNYGRNSNETFYFKNDVLYSYGSHFPVAKFEWSPVDNRRAVLFTLRGYSNSTAKHINLAWRAVQGREVIHCYSPEASHETNFNHWMEAAQSAISGLKKARKPEIYTASLQHLKNQAIAYADFFGIAIPDNLNFAFNVVDKETAHAYKVFEALVAVAA
jgi:hypothetical protein